MKNGSRNNRPIIVNEPAPPPPAGFNSWDEVRDAIWNAGLRQPGTRVFQIVGEELHEVPVEMAVVSPDGEVNDA